MPRKTKTATKVIYPTRRAYKKTQPDWSAERVKALREHLGLTQTQFADELGVLQQTVSIWELGQHTPKGASVAVLNLLAERVKFKYDASPSKDKPESES